MFSAKEISSILLLSLAVGCKHNEPVSRQVDASLERMVPAETQVLAGIDVAELRKTPLYEKLVAQKKIPQLDRFAKETGLDPRRDLEQMLVVGQGSEYVVLARGNLPPVAEIEKKLPEGTKVEHIAYKKYTLVGTEQAALVRIDDHTAIAGPGRLLRLILDQRDGPARPRAAILERTAAIPAGNQFWVVATGGLTPLPFLNSGNLSNLNQVFERLEQATVALDFRKGIHLAAHGICSNDKDAKQIQTFLKGLVGLGRLNTPTDKPELLRFFDAIQVQQEGQKVGVEADIPDDLMETLVRSLDPGHRVGL